MGGTFGERGTFSSAAQEDEAVGMDPVVKTPRDWVEPARTASEVMEAAVELRRL
jgi:hypothetical protein